jgi:hypothetical protein
MGADIKTLQRYKDAVEGYRRMFNKAGTKSASVLFTGHSLGGSIALALNNDPQFVTDTRVRTLYTTRRGKPVRDKFDTRTEYDKRGACAFDPYLDPDTEIRDDREFDKSGYKRNKAIGFRETVYAAKGDFVPEFALAYNPSVIMVSGEAIEKAAPTFLGNRPLDYIMKQTEDILNDKYYDKNKGNAYKGGYPRPQTMNHDIMHYAQIMGHIDGNVVLNKDTRRPDVDIMRGAIQ